MEKGETQTSAILYFGNQKIYYFIHSKYNQMLSPVYQMMSLLETLIYKKGRYFEFQKPLFDEINRNAILRVLVIKKLSVKIFVSDYILRFLSQSNT